MNKPPLKIGPIIITAMITSASIIDRSFFTNQVENLMAVAFSTSLVLEAANDVPNDHKEIRKNGVMSISKATIIR
jgi:hypothetical protein